MRISKLLSFLLGFSGFFALRNTEGDTGGNSTPPAGNQSAPTQRENFSREYVSELRDEAKTWRLKAQTLEAQIADANKKATDAESSATERLTAAEKAANDRVLRAELKAIAVKHGLVDLDALKLLDLSTVKLLDDGTVEGADALFEATKKAKPYLFGQGNNSSSHNEKTPPPKPTEAKHAKDMDDAEYKAAMAKYGVRV